jgi:hypothetical protein
MRHGTASVIAVFMFFVFGECGTQIKVINNYKKEVNIKIQGAGVGGCDILMEPNTENDADCWCLWGNIL